MERQFMRCFYHSIYKSALFFGILLIFSIEPGRTMPLVFRVIVRFGYQRGGFSPEGGSGQFLIQHYFIDLLELSQGKVFRHQMERQIRVIEFSAQAFKGVSQNAGVIESKGTGV